MRFTNFVTPVATSDRNYAEFRQDDGTTNGSGDFFGALDTQTNVAIMVTNCNKGL
jgi:hypothetical protein